MKILLVCDQFYSANNGMTISSRRFARVLQEHGHEVRVLGFGTANDVDNSGSAYLLKKQYIPIFDKLVSSQGMTFAKPDKAVIEKAVEWADLIHILTPFALSHKVILAARRAGKPYTAAFHVQPENITSSIHMGKIGWVNNAIYHWFNFYIYKYCQHIHCPSAFIAGELKKRGYTGKLHVISNGIDPDFVYRKSEKPVEMRDKFIVLMIVRLSVEKRQDVLIDAVQKSKYADKIQLILAGKGPRKKHLAKRANKLKNPIIIDFYPKDRLLDLIATSDLYVHAADMEIEAMSCMEAFAGGACAHHCQQ